jgi:ribonuclease-3
VANIPIAIRLLFSFKEKKFHNELKEILGFYPQHRELYDLAFTHRSASVSLEDGTFVNNERLEFLGDAVLDAVVAEFLFSRYPGRNEGFLSTMRSKIVKRKQLDVLASNLGIEKFIVANASNNNGGKHIFGNAFEALIGAIYLDKGYNNTRKFIIERILENLLNLEELEHRESDFKSRIIEWAQKNHTDLKFEIEEECTGKEHAPVFISKVFIGDKLLGQGRGPSKKEAEQNAAEQAFGTIPTMN